ncbi:hypothetical protein PVAP13_5NG370500 [Panicum virgatum]|uniref:Uncharacterized protein n=1 Tax=Panicum virgatum TaxID=38727 RepID=A0A8T0RUW4_PANVG|nr:hypothetical protein PVAP13_5NG370500 [Panicum virgatum]
MRAAPRLRLAERLGSGRRPPAARALLPCSTGRRGHRARGGATSEPDMATRCPTERSDHRSVTWQRVTFASPYERRAVPPQRPRLIPPSSAGGLLETCRGSGLLPPSSYLCTVCASTGSSTFWGCIQQCHCHGRELAGRPYEAVTSMCRKRNPAPDVVGACMFVLDQCPSYLYESICGI